MSSSDHSTSKDTTPHLSTRPPPRSSNPLLSFFRTSFTSWLPSVGSTATTNTTTTTIPPSKPLSLWSRLRSPSLASLSSRELKEELKRDQEKLRKLKEEIKRENNARLLKTSVSTGSLSVATARSSTSLSSLSTTVVPSEKVNKGGMRMPSLKLAPLEERVYVT